MCMIDSVVYCTHLWSGKTTVPYEEEALVHYLRAQQVVDETGVTRHSVKYNLALNKTTNRIFVVILNIRIVNKSLIIENKESRSKTF